VPPYREMPPCPDKCHTIMPFHHTMPCHYAIPSYHAIICNNMSCHDAIPSYHAIICHATMQPCNHATMPCHNTIPSCHAEMDDTIPCHAPSFLTRLNYHAIMQHTILHSSTTVYPVAPCHYDSPLLNHHGP